MQDLGGGREGARLGNGEEGVKVADFQRKLLGVVPMGGVQSLEEIVDIKE